MLVGGDARTPGRGRSAARARCARDPAAAGVPRGPGHAAGQGGAARAGGPRGRRRAHRRGARRARRRRPAARPARGGRRHRLPARRADPRHGAQVARAAAPRRGRALPRRDLRRRRRRVASPWCRSTRRTASARPPTPLGVRRRSRSPGDSPTSVPSSAPRGRPTIAWPTAAALAALHAAALSRVAAQSRARRRGARPRRSSASVTSMVSDVTRRPVSSPSHAPKSRSCSPRRACSASTDGRMPPAVAAAAVRMSVSSSRRCSGTAPSSASRASSSGEVEDLVGDRRPSDGRPNAVASSSTAATGDGPCSVTPLPDGGGGLLRVLLEHLELERLAEHHRQVHRPEPTGARTDASLTGSTAWAYLRPGPWKRFHAAGSASTVEVEAPGGARMPTIADVAAHAGVGPGTVSRVLNGSPKVSDGTRARVLDAIEILDYRPNPLARGLSLGSLPDPRRRRALLHPRLGRRAPAGRRRRARREPLRPRAVQRRVTRAPR